MKPYVATVGHTKSLHAAAFLRAACANGHAPALVLCVGLLNVARAKTVARSLGVRRAAQKLVHLTPLGSLLPGAVDREMEPLRAWMHEHGMPVDPNVETIAHAHGLAFERCDNLADERALAIVRAHAPAFAVYLGGGILRRPFIDAVNGVVLNAHQGPLPAIRGMNAVEWAAYLGLRPEVTVHLIDAGIDTGPLCFARPVPLDGGGIAGARGRATVLGVEMLLEAVERERAGTLPRVPQDPARGRQYFAMHPFLAELAEMKLQRLARQ